MFLQAKWVILPAFLLTVACLLVTAVPGSADPKEREPVGTTLYHRDRDHLWNRVHAALLMRVGPDGKTYGEDRLEPLLWAESKNLLEGKTAERAVAVLEEFLKEKGETLIDDPVKRAVLQRDLWMVSNWSASPSDAGAPRPLGAPLAKAIDRLALSPDQIARLPDNYAAAVAAKKYADRFDPEKPEQSYLPPDLFKPDGPWVCVGRTDGPTAPQHLEETGFNRFTNSVFLVFVKLPGGRDATLDYLKRLAAFDKPLALPNADEKSRGAYRFLPNPAVPQFPKGAEVALVRRALLLDSSRRVVPSPLTESIQLRVMRTDTPALTPELLDQLKAFSPAGLRRVAERQAFFDFQLRRADLFAEEAGGLRDVSGERDFKTGFASHQWDEFGERGSAASTGQPFPQRSQPFENNRASCAICHPLPGVYGFNSLQDFRAGIARDGDKLKPYSLAAMKVEEVEKAAIKRKETQVGGKLWK
jgi:hypothetical protein